MLEGKSGLFLLGSAMAAVVAGVYKLVKDGNEPIETNYIIQHKEWKSTVTIAKKKIIQESDWAAPSGAKIIDTKVEFKEMQKVPVGIDSSGEMIYKEVPYYDTKYYYEVEKYVSDRSVSSSGCERYFGDTMTCPHYPVVQLAPDEKISNKSMHYGIMCKNLETGELKSFSVKSDIWNTLAPGNRVCITTTKWAPNSIKSIRTMY